ncbi:hypothetical protein AAF712_004543 [Marasmius tenuissimus]|uniref:Uncharacterized protein n=1 Tax=Marasmius tenuissimus TaxID=585030 RepID=A0ABR3A4P1_9AGAR
MASPNKVLTEKTDESLDDRASLHVEKGNSADEQHTQLARELKNRHVAMISIGGQAAI